MWIPKTEDEIESVVASGSLCESRTFDAKESIAKNNKEIAKDIAAMTVDGGVLLYGVKEDANKRLTSLTPITLKGEPERIDAIVRSSISEPPEVHISTIPTANDPSIGYLVVIIPPSPRAPHMVIVGDDFRYYGRGETGNIRLSEGDVARLYARRRQSERDRNEMLEQVIQRARLHPSPKFAYIHLMGTPVLSDSGLLQRAAEGAAVTDIPTLLNKILVQVGQQKLLATTPYPTIPTYTRWYQQVGDWIAYLEQAPGEVHDQASAKVLDLTVGNDGSSYFFYNRAGKESSNRIVLLEDNIAWLTTRFLLLLGTLYENARYAGQVDIGIAITGIQGAISDFFRRQPYLYPYEYPTLIFKDEKYTSTARVAARTLAEDPKRAARELVMPLVNAITQGNYDPFREPQKGSA